MFFVCVGMVIGMGDGDGYYGNGDALGDGVERIGMYLGMWIECGERCEESW